MAKEKKTTQAPPMAVAQLAGKSYDLKGFTRKTAPPVVPPAKLPPGTIVGGTVLAIATRELKEGKKTKKTELLHLRSPDGMEVLFPVGTVIRTALTKDGEKLSDIVGKEIAISVLPPKISPTYKREYFNAEIFVREE